MLNCPNCGAPITGNVCEYCGTVFETEDEETITLYADNVPYVIIKRRREK